MCPHNRSVVVVLPTVWSHLHVRYHHTHSIWVWISELNRWRSSWRQWFWSDGDLMSHDVSHDDGGVMVIVMVMGYGAWSCEFRYTCCVSSAVREYQVRTSGQNHGFLGPQLPGDKLQQALAEAMFWHILRHIPGQWLGLVICSSGVLEIIQSYDHRNHRIAKSQK